MKKRMISLFLALALVCACMPKIMLPAMAQDSDFVIENGVLTKYNGAGGAITIPDHVTAIGERAFAECTELTGVTFGSSVERIGDYAFFGCDLSNVTIPACVGEIGSGAFVGNTNLAEVTILNPDCVIDLEHQSISFDADILDEFDSGPFYDGYDHHMVVTIAGFQCSTAEKCAAICNHAFRDIEDNLPLIDRRTLYRTVADAERLDTSMFLGGEAMAEFDEALAAAKNILSDATASQDAVDAAARAVRHAVDALEPGETFRFVDVRNPNRYYYDSVYWAFRADPQVTTGIDKTHFGPTKSCTRGQTVTFLWRVAGCPEPGISATPFVDVVPGAYYAKAVAWAVENGITNGMDATHFGPDNPCTRAHVVTFLWRASGRREPGTAATPFTDMKPGAFYVKAVAWAVENGITNGMSPNCFGAEMVCSRGDIVTFLFRATAQE